MPTENVLGHFTPPPPPPPLLPPDASPARHQRLERLAHDPQQLRFLLGAGVQNVAPKQLPVCTPGLVSSPIAVSPDLGNLTGAVSIDAADEIEAADTQGTVGNKAFVLCV